MNRALLHMGYVSLCCSSPYIVPSVAGARSHSVQRHCQPPSGKSFLIMMPPQWRRILAEPAQAVEAECVVVVVMFFPKES